MDYVDALKRVRPGNRYPLIRFVCGHDVPSEEIEWITNEDPAANAFLEVMGHRMATSLTKLGCSFTEQDSERSFRFLRDRKRREELLSLVRPEWQKDFLSFVEDGYATLGFTYYYQSDENCRRAIAEAHKVMNAVLNVQYLDLQNEPDLVS